MAKFCVVMEETIRYFVDVEAEDQEDAREAAAEAFVQSENPFDEFRASVESRSTQYVTSA